MKKDYTKVIVYQYPFTATKEEKEFVWDPPVDELDKLFLGLPWRDILLSFMFRNDLYWGFDIKGESDMFSILEGKVELDVASLLNPHFSLELAVMPSKLSIKQRELLNQIFLKYKDDENFIAFWEEDGEPPPPGKRQLNLKKKLCKALETIPTYDGENDITPEKAVITPMEALGYFGFSKNEVPSQEEFKKRVRELQFKCHPDVSGSEKEFKHLQKCKKIVEDFVFTDE